MQQTIKFETRRSDIGPVCVDNYKPDDKIDSWEPEAGNTVSLKSAGVSIVVRITEAQNREYKGEVSGFEQWGEYEFRGLKPLDSVRFSYAHIFSYMR